MPPIRDNGPCRSERLTGFELPESEKKGVMCARCHAVQWGAGITVDNARCGKCGNTLAAEFINVSSADFNRYSGRYMGGARL